MVGGTTSSVQSMIMASVKAGEKIIMPRNVHRSAINAMILTGAIPIYVNPEVDKRLGISLGMSIDQVKQAIIDNPDAKAILVNNPTYYGICSNLKEIVRLAHEHNMLALVDEAHGTHFYFSDDLPMSAMEAGADMASVSMHKSGGSLTQSSFLLLGPNVNADYVRQVINLTQTTSGSYLLMVSLDMSRKNLALNGKEIFSKVRRLAHYAREEINQIGDYYAYCRELINGDSVYDFDVTKLSIFTLDVGLAGIEVYDLLRDEYGIQIEFGDIGNVLAYISVGDSEANIERLVGALSEIRRRFKKDRSGMLDHEYINPEVVISPQAAFYGEKESLPLMQSVDRVCSEFVMCYPPGIPILAPGEKITKEILDYIQYAKDKGCFMTGPEDMEINNLNVTKGVKFSIKVDRQLFTGHSEFQRIDIFDSKEFGRFLALDGYMMLTEKDEFIYHEMIVHVPMAVHPNVKKVLVIGAGDGGVIRELCRYETIETIDMVEIDELVVEVSKKYLPTTACCFDDPRLNIYYQDGLKFVRTKENEYDLIIVDSTDPFGPGEGLFTKEFYGNCFKALNETGIMVNQHESPFYQDDAVAMQRAHKRIVESFPISRVYQAHIPTYPSGHWLFGFASKKYHPIKDFQKTKWNARGMQTRYYNTGIHVGAFALPNYVEELLRDVE